MKDYYLKFKDKQEMCQALMPRGFMMEDDTMWCEGVTIDIIGIVTTLIPHENDEGFDVISKPDWYVNLRVLDDSPLDVEGLEAYDIAPELPSRVFA